MKAKGIFISNEEAIEQADQLDIQRPETEYVELPFLFDIASAETAFRNSEGDIVLYMKHSGSYRLRYDSDLWQKLEKHFSQHKIPR